MIIVAIVVAIIVVVVVIHWLALHGVVMVAATIHVHGVAVVAAVIHVHGVAMVADGVHWLRIRYRQGWGKWNSHLLLPRKAARGIVLLMATITSDTSMTCKVLLGVVSAVIVAPHSTCMTGVRDSSHHHLGMLLLCHELHLLGLEIL